MSITAIGAIVALVIAIIAIIWGVPPAYGMMLGALIGGIAGGASLASATGFMFTGAAGMSTSLLRIMAAGVLAGVLIESGSADVIAESIVMKLGSANALIAITLSTWLLTAIGIFGDVATITVAPIALQIASKANYTKSTIMVAMIGGMHAGNVMSPNPQAIALAEYFQIPLTSVMAGGMIPAVFGLVATIGLAKHVRKKGFGTSVDAGAVSESRLTDRPGLPAALMGPIVSIFCLALRPLANIVIDPLIALPLGGLVGCLLVKRPRHFVKYASSGLNRMSGVVLLLLGTGTLAGIISNSGLKDLVINAVGAMGLPGFMLAPIAGASMGAATASSTAGCTVASQVFGSAILSLGVLPIQAAVMIHAGSNVLDGLPHGSYFHTSAGSIGMGMKERLRVLPYESCVGIVMTLAATIVYGVLKFHF